MSTSDVERHERVCRIFLAALEHSVEQRERFVADACGADPELRAEVERWLAAHDQAERGDDALLGELPIQALSAALFDRLRTDLRRDETEARSSAFRFPRDVGAYVLLGVLGEGGMGIVYVAEQKRPPRRVALKMIRPSFASASSLRRFEAEACTLARLQHPGIAQIYDAGEIELDGERRAYLAMELVEGALLGAFATRTDLDDAQRMRVLVALCLAVHHAHQKGVIHRDLKPGNVIVDVEGRPRVLDFGVARLVDDPASLTTQDTLAARLVGTLPYMSPEHFAGDTQALDTRSDVYSLGVIAYELLSGRLPHDFTRKSLPEVARVVRDESPRLLGTIDARLRGDVEAIVSKALEKEPERRYASALDLARDLERHLAHEPVTARPPSTTYRLRRFARRHRTLAASVVALVLALGAGFATSTALYVRAEDRARELLQLSDLRNVTLLERRAGELWPPTPDRIDLYERWLSDADELIARRSAHARTLQSIRARALSRPNSASDTRQAANDAVFEFASSDDAWWHDSHVAVITALDALSDPETGLARGRARVGEWSIDRRLQMARSIEERTVTGPDARRRWDEAIRSIADVRECPRYQGLRIQPQVGLLPLGRDPQSGLWEFAHIASGEPPWRRPETSRWKLQPETGVVLVLLPGGPTPWGTTDDYALSDKLCAWDDPLDPIEVWIAPFLMSKYEMTQGQCLFIRGVNPSDAAAGQTFCETVVDATHPLESITYVEAERMLACVGLRLPTHQEWQHACRTDVSSWLHALRRDPSVHGNFADARLLEIYPREPADPWVDDGHGVHAPVGSYAANPFGLHDMLGNVYEFVHEADDSFVRYYGGSFMNRGSRTGVQAAGRMNYQGARIIGVRPCASLSGDVGQ